MGKENAGRFTGGNQSGQWGNREFVRQHIAGKGALGDFFISKKGDIKMGDTPSVGWVLRGKPACWWWRIKSCPAMHPAMARCGSVSARKPRRRTILQSAATYPGSTVKPAESQFIRRHPVWRNVRQRICPTGGRTIHPSSWRKETTWAPRQSTGGVRNSSVTLQLAWIDAGVQFPLILNTKM